MIEILNPFKAFQYFDIGFFSFREQDSSSAAAIASRQHPWLKVGGRYSRKDSTDIHIFAAMTDHVARFRVIDPWGNESEVEVKHGDLKGMKATEKEAPTILDSGLVAALGLSSFKGLYEERCKSEALHALYEHYQQPLAPKSMFFWFGYILGGLRIVGCILRVQCLS